MGDAGHIEVGAGGDIIAMARREGRVVLTEMESKQLLAGIGIRTTAMRSAIRAC